MQLLNERCLRCGGALEAQEDQYGAMVRCVSCGRYRDLEQETPEHLAFLVKVATHNEEQAAKNAKQKQWRKRKDRAPFGGENRLGGRSNSVS